MDSNVISALIGAISVILAAIIAYKAAESKTNKNTELVFETTDYIKHIRSHRLPIEGIKNAFIYSTTIEELSERLMKLSNSKLTCDHFKAEMMKTKFLTSINNARRTLNAKEFNNEGLLD